MVFVILLLVSKHLAEVVISQFYDFTINWNLLFGFRSKEQGLHSLNSHLSFHCNFNYVGSIPKMAFDENKSRNRSENVNLQRSWDNAHWKKCFEAVPARHLWFHLELPNLVKKEICNRKNLQETGKKFQIFIISNKNSKLLSEIRTMPKVQKHICKRYAKCEILDMYGMLLQILNTHPYQNIFWLDISMEYTISDRNSSKMQVSHHFIFISFWEQTKIDMVCENMCY